MRGRATLKSTHSVYFRTPFRFPLTRNDSFLSERVWKLAFFQSAIWMQVSSCPTHGHGNTRPTNVGLGKITHVLDKLLAGLGGNPYTYIINTHNEGPENCVLRKAYYIRARASAQSKPLSYVFREKEVRKFIIAAFETNHLWLNRNVGGHKYTRARAVAAIR